jgi:oxygen-independent coproporphyrinogen-3 oxidase
MYMDKALAGQAVSNEQAVAASELPFEFMLNALRLADGVELQRFVERTGQSIAAIDAKLERARARSLIELSDARVKPTPRGFDFLSDLQSMFL